jgi:hypothetical protein
MGASVGGSGLATGGGGTCSVAGVGGGRGDADMMGGDEDGYSEGRCRREGRPKGSHCLKEESISLTTISCRLDGSSAQTLGHTYSTRHIPIKPVELRVPAFDSSRLTSLQPEFDLLEQRVVVISRRRRQGTSSLHSQ